MHRHWAEGAGSFGSFGVQHREFQNQSCEISHKSFYQDKMAERTIPIISLKGIEAFEMINLELCCWIWADYENRKDEITKQLVHAAETAGFLTLVDHGITIDEIEAQFAISKSFFDLPAEIKSKTPHDTRTNNGWEYKVRDCIWSLNEASDIAAQAQLRQSTGSYDQKESLWLQLNSEWPDDEDVPKFRQTTTNFMAKCADVSDQVCKLTLETARTCV